MTYFNPVNLLFEKQLIVAYKPLIDQGTCFTMSNPVRPMLPLFWKYPSRHNFFGTVVGYCFDVFDIQKYMTAAALAQVGHHLMLIVTQRDQLGLHEFKMSIRMEEQGKCDTISFQAIPVFQRQHNGFLYFFPTHCPLHWNSHLLIALLKSLQQLGESYLCGYFSHLPVMFHSIQEPFIIDPKGVTININKWLELIYIKPCKIALLMGLLED